MTRRWESGKRETGVRRLAQLWFTGWEAFAGVAGGRAQDLVGGNPWRTGRDDAGVRMESDRAQG